MNYGGYNGSPSIMTSTANQEIVENIYRYRNFSFVNYDVCTVKINGSDPIYLDAGQGFSADSGGNSIKSFIVIESGVNYNWIGEYEYVVIR